MRHLSKQPLFHKYPNMEIMYAHTGQVRKVVVGLRSQAKLQPIRWLKLQVLHVMYDRFTVNFNNSNNEKTNPYSDISCMMSTSFSGV